VRQGVFADVQITIRQRVAGLSVLDQSFAPIGLHKTDAASDWLLIKVTSIYRKEDVLFQPKIRGDSEKIKNQPRPLLRPRSVNFRQHFRNISRKTVPF
jgi:hypothetical protein